jgi:gluconate 5-dehydrogenase
MIDLFDLHGRTALVTGAAAGGLGEQAALSLGRAGARIVVSDLPGQADGLADTVHALLSAGIDATSMVCDVTDAVSVEALVTSDQVGERLDIVVNAAGAMLRRGVFDTTPEEFRRILDVNVTGTWLVNRAAGRKMVAAGSGKIINISSVYADRVGPVPESAYYASKAAVANTTRSLASEFGTSGVHVNCLALGVFYPTKITAALADAPDTLAWFTERTLLKRLGDPARDLAGPLLLLSCAASDYITGQVIYVDGGWSAW